MVSYLSSLVSAPVSLVSSVVLAPVSLVSYLWGAQSQAAPEAAPSLAQASESLEGKIQQLEQNIAKAQGDAKQWISKGATHPSAEARAKQSLKKKKMLQQQLDHLLVTQFNVQNLQFQTEQAQNTATAVTAMRSVAEDLKRQQEQQHISVDQVDELMQDQADLAADMQDIQAALASAPGMYSDMDDEAAKDLAALYEDKDVAEEAAKELAASYEENEVAKLLLAGGARTAPPAYVPSTMRATICHDAIANAAIGAAAGA